MGILLPAYLHSRSCGSGVCVRACAWVCGRAACSFAATQKQPPSGFHVFTLEGKREKLFMKKPQGVKARNELSLKCWKS